MCRADPVQEKGELVLMDVSPVFPVSLHSSSPGPSTVPGSAGPTIGGIAKTSLLGGMP